MGSLKSKKTNFVAKHGNQLIDHGHQLCLIQHGFKFPTYPRWTERWLNKEGVKKHSKSSGTGLGVICGEVVGIDLDIEEPELLAQAKGWCKSNLGNAPVRIGKPPRELWVYRTDEPFKKKLSTKYVHAFGYSAQIEILGKGQQFMAYGWHPKTGKPYTYPELSLVDVPIDQLTCITEKQADELIEYFESVVSQDEHYEQVSKSPRTNTKKRTAKKRVVANDPLLNLEPPLDISDEEVLAVLEVLDPDDYETWYKTGMALYHQYQGNEKGFQIWDKWSSKNG